MEDKMLSEMKWDNHPILENLKLCFKKPDGNIYKTIVFVGNNGCGKTTILNSISDFINSNTIEHIDYLEYSVNGKFFKNYKLPNSQMSNLGFHYREDLKLKTRKEVRTNKHNSFQSLLSDIEDLRSYGSLMSKARSGFKTNKVKSSTTLQLDNDKYNEDNSDDFTQIKQLLIDINEQDNARYTNLNKKEIVKWEDFYPSSKTYRFEKAFNTFFKNIKYIGINEECSEEKEIVFKKNNKTINIDDLSTGEKQIVFRGSSLLRNSQNINGGIVLIDEPELSMHPQWQKDILNFYKNLFTQNNTQIAQIFIATHSEYVLKSALEDKDTLVILLNDNNGIIKSKNILAPFILPSITFAEINYFAFNIPSGDYHNQLYGYLQNKFNKTTIKAADDFICHNTKYDITKHGKPSRFGRIQYNTLPTFIRNLIDHPNYTSNYTEEELETSIQLLIELCK